MRIQQIIDAALAHDVVDARCFRAIGGRALWFPVVRVAIAGAYDDPLVGRVPCTLIHYVRSDRELLRVLGY